MYILDILNFLILNKRMHEHEGGFNNFRDFFCYYASITLTKNSQSPDTKSFSEFQIQTIKIYPTFNCMI